MIPVKSRPGGKKAATAMLRQRKRSSKAMFIGVGVTLALVLLAGAAFVVRQSISSHAAPVEKSFGHGGGRITTITGLNTLAQIGSTANILDTQGNQITVDPNPYKIAVAPQNLSNGVKAGDILVSNIGNNDHGITLVKFSGQNNTSTGQLFNTATDGVLGPAGLAFDNGKLLVGNSTGSNVLVFNTDGTLFKTIQDPLFNGPWGITTGNTAFQSHSRISSFFTANKFDAKILRVDVKSQGGSAPTFQVTQVGQFTKNGDLTKIDLHWMPALKVGSHILHDVLLAIDPANNRIAAFANSSTLQGIGNGTTVFQGTPLNMPGGFAINPLNGDLLVVNLMDNNLVELNPTSGQVIGTKQIDPAMVDNQGNGSALFGVVGLRDQKGNLRVVFTDDNTNTLDSLSA